MIISPYAGQLPEVSDLVDIPRLLLAYDAIQPDPSVIAQQVQFGTSGHRGSSLQRSFNRDHILAICQSVCWYREKRGITGPLFLGMDTHALSLPAFHTALEVLSANGVTLLIAPDGEFTPTPAVSHAILEYNRNRDSHLADGIIITPSHNPPSEGGIKYNPPHGGPAEKEITDWIRKQANDVLESGLSRVLKLPLSKALAAPTTRRHDYLGHYVRDLANVVDMEIIRDSKIRLGVDPLGGAGIHFWPKIAELYKIDLTVTNTALDPTFRFVTRDWDGKTRMDPSSSYAMQGLIRESRKFDLSFGCDTDHDRHGIVTPREGLMPANHYLAVAIDYLFRNRPQWPSALKVGKTAVSSQIIDRLVASLQRGLYETPVGFKWFVEGLHSATLGFAGEESAGATFLRMNSRVWTTDKDGLIPALLAAEMTARTGKDPAVRYHELTQALGAPLYRRVEAPANAQQRNRLQTISGTAFSLKALAGEAVTRIATLGGIKVEAANGWFAARPSGTEDIYKIYAESFLSPEHLDLIVREAQSVVDAAIQTL